MTDLVAQLVGALEDLLIDMKIAQSNMRSAAKRDPSWEGCAETIQPRVDAAVAALSAAKDGGWVAVPLEPTPQMIRAAQNVPEARGIRWHQCHKQKWAAMLAARPLPNPPKGEA